MAPHLLGSRARQAEGQQQGGERYSPPHTLLLPFCTPLKHLLQPAARTLAALSSGTLPRSSKPTHCNLTHTEVTDTCERRAAQAEDVVPLCHTRHSQHSPASAADYTACLLPAHTACWWQVLLWVEHWPGACSRQPISQQQLLVRFDPVAARLVND